MLGGFVFWLEAAGVFGGEGFFGEVEFDDDFFFVFELHDEERVAGLALPEGRIEADDDEGVDVVRFGEQEEFLNGGKLDLVVVGFAAEAERGIVHVNIEAASISHGLGGWSKSEVVGQGGAGRRERKGKTDLGVRCRTSRKVATVSPATSPISALSISVS